MKKFSPCAVLLALVSTSTAIHPQNRDAFDGLQQWYNQSIGLYVPSTGWWNSANCITVIAHLAQIDQTINVKSRPIFSNTFAEAPEYNLQLEKEVDESGLMRSFYGDHWPFLPQGQRSMNPVKQPAGFLNDYYDDEGWWALAWIDAYDVTHDSQYLQTAESIFKDMDKAYGTTPCGGIWWNKQKEYVNDITNELYLDVAAHLANRVHGRARQSYVDQAKDEWQWFQESGMINSGNFVNDGLTNDTCENNGRTTWSYNQGVILGGLTELYRATGDDAYIEAAKPIADAAIKGLIDENGILHDDCEPDCDDDGSQFKGVFARNLQILHKASPESRYDEFLNRNADSIWQNDRQGNELSLMWSGPFVNPANASTQSSALDALVAALAT